MPLLGNVVISKNFLRTRKIMVMHSNERGECCPRTLVDRQRKRYHNAVDVVVRLHDPTDQVPNARHLRVQHTFSSMTSLELRSSRVLRESFVSTTAWWRWWCSTDAGLHLSFATVLSRCNMVEGAPHTAKRLLINCCVSGVPPCPRI